MSAAVFVLLAAAGAALVVQNLLMTRISADASTILIPLVMNSAVGLVLLLTLLIGRAGLPGIHEAVAALRFWSLLPGLLGSFFVFASILGYQRLGATATIATLVASQLVVGLLVDMMKSGGIRGYETAIAGAVLLGTGAILVTSRPS